MAINVIIPTPLRQYTGGQATLSARGETVAGVLAAILSEHPQLRANIISDEGKLHPFLHVFVNGLDIAGSGGLETAVPEDGEVLIVQAISGG